MPTEDAGKRNTQRETGELRRDKNSCPTTSGSLGLDLAASVDCVLHTNLPQRIPTNVYGPIKINGNPVGALLLGHSSSTMKGLFVLPGVIDADYQGEIQIMVTAIVPPIQIKKHQRIAQLLPFPALTNGHEPAVANQRTGGFGSTGDTLADVKN
uniref:Uncharacterized protein n=1 Tax=Melopsittacus undulatus TaxID=13146 RepID=A0A8V5H155_MELUD